jgi:hypothetical protein
LFAAWSGAGEGFDVGCNVDWSDARESKSFFAAPGKKVADGAGVSEAGVFVSDVGGKELDEAFFSVRAFAGDEVWEP